MLDFIPKITSEDVGDQSGTFVVEPLDRGFGYTFGNSLRRVLLSALEGAAVTSVKIEGVAHEFTSVPGVREDVTDIILNLKNLICKLHGESGEVEVQVQKDGPGVVRASDIEAPADLEILNPNLEICNLGAGARFEMTLTIARGRGYVAADGNKGPETTIGVIPVDSIFSPVRRVSYDVDAARVGQRTDFDKLKLEVTTDGSMTPKDAVKDADPLPVDLHRHRRRRAGDPPRGRRRRGGRPQRPRHGEHPDRRAGAGRPQLQLPEAGRHRDDRRPGRQDRGRAGRDPELRQEVDRRGQGDPGRPRPHAAGSRVGHEAPP
jgi:hypothetical protein